MLGVCLTGHNLSRSSQDGVSNVFYVLVDWLCKKEEEEEEETVNKHASTSCRSGLDGDRSVDI